MKVPADSLAALSAAIRPMDTPARRARYLAGQFPNADRVKLLDMRYRWDLYWLLDHTYTGAILDRQEITDTHLDTALRAVVPPLEGQP